MADNIEKEVCKIEKWGGAAKDERQEAKKISEPNCSLGYCGGILDNIINNGRILKNIFFDRR